MNGGVVADGESASGIVVHVVKSAHRRDPAEVEVTYDRRPNGDIVLYALYPGSGNRYEKGESHAMTHDNDVTVEWEVHVPRGVGLAARTVNRGITLDRRT